MPSLGNEDGADEPAKRFLAYIKREPRRSEPTGLDCSAAGSESSICRTLIQFAPRGVRSGSRDRSDNGRRIGDWSPTQKPPSGSVAIGTVRHPESIVLKRVFAPWTVPRLHEHDVVKAATSGGQRRAARADGAAR